MSDDRTTGVLVVDDDALVRAWLRFALAGTEFHIAGEADSIAAALNLSRRRLPALLLVDYHLQDGFGTDLLEQLRQRYGAIPSLLITASPTEGLNELAQQAGAHGTLLKSDTDTLLQALRRVHGGGRSYDQSHPRRSANHSTLGQREPAEARHQSAHSRGTTNRHTAGVPSEAVWDDSTGGRSPTRIRPDALRYGRGQRRRNTQASFLEVRDQHELDVALALGNTPICVGDGEFQVSADGVVLARGNAHVRAFADAAVGAADNAHVEAHDRTHVDAAGSSQIVANDSTSVAAIESAQVIARDRASIDATDHAHVLAYDQTDVHATGLAHVWASRQASVRAAGGARVEAFDAAQVTASEHAHVIAHDHTAVTATGASHIEATDRATVTATGSTRVTATGESFVGAFAASSVEAREHSTVKSHGARVVAEGNATVDAWGNSRITQYDAAVVHRHGDADILTNDTADRKDVQA